jgi:hypothetical protein
MFTALLILIWNLGCYVRFLETGKLITDYSNFTQIIMSLFLIFCLFISVNLDIKLLNKF